MKNFFLILAALLGLLLPARADIEYSAVASNAALRSGTTNSFIVDTRNTSGLALQVALQGTGVNTTTALIGVTNAANAATPQTVTVTIAGTNYVYSWAANPQLLVTNYSLPATNIVITVTNAAIAAGTNNPLTVSLDNRTNTFTWAAQRYYPTNIATGTGTAAEATNIYNTLASFYPALTITVAGSSVTINGRTGDGQLSVGDATGGTTNVVGSYYTVTNIVSTNSMQLLTTNTAALAAVNLFTQLSNDFSGILTVTQPSATVVSLVTIGNPGLTVAESGSWATNAITTNAIAGGINFNASNSLDKVTWFSAPSRSFSLAFNNTSQVTLSTNFTDIFSAGWWKWSEENASTNYADAIGVKILSATKRGL